MKMIHTLAILISLTALSHVIFAQSTVTFKRDGVIGESVFETSQLKVLKYTETDRTLTYDNSTNVSSVILGETWVFTPDEDYVVSIDNPVQANELQITQTSETIQFQHPDAKTVEVYNLQGQLISQSNFSEGNSQIQIPMNSSYIVRIQMNEMQPQTFKLTIQ